MKRIYRCGVTTGTGVASPQAQVWRHHRHRCGATTDTSVASPQAQAWRQDRHRCGVGTGVASAQVWRHHRHRCGATTGTSGACAPITKCNSSHSVWCIKCGTNARVLCMLLGDKKTKTTNRGRQHATVSEYGNKYRRIKIKDVPKLSYSSGLPETGIATYRRTG